MTLPLQVGQRYGRWTIISKPTKTGSNGRPEALCRCECGTERVVLAQTLRQGKPNASCGCWRRERTAVNIAQTRWRDSHGRAGSTAHGGKADPMYRRWQNIKKRCFYAASDNYQWYGGRGITMHPAWINDAGAFIDWIETNLGPCPLGKSLDRIDNDGNYEPGNLRWATQSEQIRNRRRSNAL